MSKRRKPGKKPQLPDLIFGREPEEFGGDGNTFVLAERIAALKAVAAHKARTWAEFTAVAGIPFAEMMEDWGEEIEEYYGVKPTENSSFSLIECWGATYFADVISEPRQVVAFLMMDHPEMRRTFEQTGFKIEWGPPGAGVDSMVFPDRSCLTLLPTDIAVHIQEDETLLRACLLGEID